MKHRPKLHLHIGLRTFKTALAVTIALLIAGALDSYSPIFAGLGAIVAMARTLHDALREARTQFVGVILGGRSYITTVTPDGLIASQPSTHGTSVQDPAAGSIPSTGDSSENTV